QRVPHPDDSPTLPIVNLPQGPVIFRPLGRTDFVLLERWLREPHVLAWWREALDLTGLETKYGPRIDGDEPTHVFVIEYQGPSVGGVVCDPEVLNVRSCRAFEKAGFRSRDSIVLDGETVARVIVRLNRTGTITAP